MFNFLRNLFKPSPPFPQWGPETDVDTLNRGVCPDCGSASRTNDGFRVVECQDCGSAFNVTPCCNPPYMTADHIGFNRNTRAGK